MSRPILHVITRRSASRSHLDVLRAGVEGGADVVQFREKDPEARRALAPRLAREIRSSDALLVVNDDLELAIAIGADGVHLGPDDLPIAAARKRWPRPARLGASAREPERAARLERDGADYLGVGPVFATVSKPGLPSPIGLDGLARVARAVVVPVIGIGGVDADNAADVVAAGAAGVAVLSFVTDAAEPARAVEALRRALDANVRG